jgi:hypothetical protein
MRLLLSLCERIVTWYRRPIIAIWWRRIAISLISVFLGLYLVFYTSLGWCMWEEGNLLIAKGLTEKDMLGVVRCVMVMDERGYDKFLESYDKARPIFVAVFPDCDWFDADKPDMPKKP